MSGKGRCAAVLATIILSAAFGESAFAGGGIQVGTLTCNASSSWGFIFGSTREVDCTFTRLAGSKSTAVRSRSSALISVNRGRCPDLDGGRADGGAAPRRPRWQLWRRNGQRNGRDRGRSLCPGWRQHELDRAPATQY